MRNIYNSKSLAPLDPVVLRQLDDAATRLIEKVAGIDYERLPFTPSGKETVARVKTEVAGTIKKYVHLMSWALHPGPIAENLVLVDYGGGLGLMSCLAKEARIPIVVYNDIFEPCCKDAQVFARQLGLEADAYVCGDIHELSRALEPRRQIRCALVSINVIEHIYDMDDFLRAAAGLSRAGVTMVLSTSANPLNPLVRRRHFRQHRLWEFTDGPHPGWSPMDTLKAFHDVRRDMIKQFAPRISEPDLKALTAATRGLRKEEIERCVRDFQQTGKITAVPEHPTNTCDPFTGNWQERLLNIEAVSQTLRSLGFEVQIAGGYYDARANHPAIRLIKQSTAPVLNYAISLLGPQGARLAPCFMFHAVQRSHLDQPREATSPDRHLSALAGKR